MSSFFNFCRGFHKATPFRSEADKVKSPPAARSAPAAAPTPTTPAGASEPGYGNIGRPKLTPTALDKKFLIWSGHYKTKAEIPGALDYDVIQKTRSWARIRINLSAMVVVIVGSFGMVYMGKQAAKRGEFLETENLEWHRKNREEYLRSQEAEKAIK